MLEYASPSEVEMQPQDLLLNSFLSLLYILWFPSAVEVSETLDDVLHRHYMTLQWRVYFKQPFHFSQKWHISVTAVIWPVKYQKQGNHAKNSSGWTHSLFSGDNFPLCLNSRSPDLTCRLQQQLPLHNIFFTISLLIQDHPKLSGFLLFFFFKTLWFKILLVSKYHLFK